MKKLLLLLLFIPLVSIGQLNIETKYNPPEGFERVYNDDYSKFLRQFPLKKDNIVKLFDGSNKYNNNIWDAVLDYDLGTHKYHQCADAVLYMRANFLHKHIPIAYKLFNQSFGLVPKFHLPILHLQEPLF